MCAADLNALSKLPVLTAIRAGTSPALSCSRICFQRLPTPGSTGGSAHFTFSCAAAWIAAYSLSATTPRKSPKRTIFAPAMPLIELSSTERIVGAVPSP